MAKTRCLHVKSVNITWSDINAIKKSQVFCEACQDKGINQWLCLESNCRFVGCGSKVNDHSSEHYKTNGHPLSMNLHNNKIYCYECDYQVLERNNIPSFVIAESDCPNRHTPRSKSHTVHPSFPNSRPSSTCSSNYDYDDFDHEGINGEASKPLGLTGLKNLGNTCYMNSALQALSNCPQLTQYFIECAETVHTEKKPMLALHYKRLLLDMWHKKRPSYVIPSGVCTGIMFVHPMFRGFAQQDSQEFLRCFMDQLHEELKVPIMDHNSPSSSPIGQKKKSSADSELEENMCDITNGTLPNSSPHISATLDDSTALQPKPSGDQSSIATEEGTTPLLPRNSSSSSITSGESSPNSSSTSGVGSGGSRFTKQSSDTLRSSENSRKPRSAIQYRSIISDVFNGKLLSSVQCLTCERVSSTKEVFQDLSLPISSQDSHSGLSSCTNTSSSLGIKLGAVGGSTGCGLSSAESTGGNVSNDGGGGGSSGVEKYRVTVWLDSFYRWMKSWFVGPSITLQDCLAAFFSEDELKGDNMYSCEKCQKLRNGLKCSRLLELPEVLCIHLKRFRHNFSFSSKITSYVAFPIEGLDMAPYIQQEPGEKSSGGRVTVYDLVSVVCHRGTAGGGHYTAYALNPINQCWYEYDDVEVTEVDVNTVANCEAYILFYRKQDDRMIPIRHRADNLIQNAEVRPNLGHPYTIAIFIVSFTLSFCNQPGDSLFKFYLSKPWIVQFNTFAEPSPITNDDFVCRHGALQPSKALLKDDLAMEISQDAWNYLYKKFDGGPSVTHLYVCKMCQEIEDKLKARQTYEFNHVVSLHEAFRASSDPPSSYAISIGWFKEWEDFARGKESEPPGPIDNSNIVASHRGPGGVAVLRRSACDFAQVSQELWLFLHGIYSGGPECCLKQAPLPSSTNPSPQQEGRGSLEEEADGVDRREDKLSPSPSASVDSGVVNGVD